MNLTESAIKVLMVVCFLFGTSIPVSSSVDSGDYLEKRNFDGDISSGEDVLGDSDEDLNESLFLYGIPQSLIESCNLEARAVSEKSELYPTLEFDNEIVGVGELLMDGNVTHERVYIFHKDSCSIDVIEHSLPHRPISKVSKIAEDRFSFVFMAQPHYGHYYEYDLNGNQIETYTLVDECYLVGQVTGDLKEEYIAICESSPKLRSISEFDDL